MCVIVLDGTTTTVNVRTPQPDEAELNLPIVLYEDDRGI